MSMFKKSPLLPKDWRMPIEGEVIPLSDLPDQMFAEGMMGAGFAIKAAESLVRSPVNGEIVSIFPGGHAMAMVTDNGCELLIHVGIDSVGLKGEGFTPMVESGKKVSIGEPLVDVDFALLDSRLVDSSVVIVFTEIEEGRVEVSGEKLTWHDTVK